MISERTPAELFASATALFGKLRHLPQEERQAALAARCPGDAELRAEVLALLAEHERLSDEPVSPRDEASTLHRLVDVSLGERPSAWAVPDRLGPYRILRPLGTGGMGQVFEAEQDEPRRRVAIKVLRPEIGSPDMRARFRREGDLLALLRHEGIARIHAVGESAGLLYLVMELVEGDPLDVASRRLSPDARVRLVAAAADAVAHAHRNGVIHRDLKPRNVLVTPEGQPKVLDFGVARSLEGTKHTTTGSVVGTLAYMSPEQLVGRADVDTRSDVYALGVMLYEALAGHRPFHAHEATPASLLGAVQAGRPPRLADAGSGVSSDMDVILATALSPDPDRRYASADALREDLGRYLAKEPIWARAPTRLYQLRKFVARNRVLVGAASVALLALVAALAVSVSMMATARRERERATRQAAAARLSDSQRAFAAASLAIRADRPWEARPYLAAVDPEHRGWAWEHMRACVETAVERVAWDAARQPAGVRVAAGETLEVLDALPVSDAAPVPWHIQPLEGVVLWEGEVCRAAPTELPHVGVEVEPGVLLQRRFPPYTMREVATDVAGEEHTIARYRAYSNYGPYALDAVRRRLASADSAGGIWLWERGRGLVEPQAAWTIHRPISQVAFTPQGAHLLLGGLRGGIQRLDVDTGELEAVGGLDGSVMALCGTAAGGVLAASPTEAALFVPDVAPVTVLRPHGSGSGPWQGPYVYGLALTPDARLVISGGWDGTVRVLDTRTQRLVATIPAAESVRAVSYDAASRRLAIIHRTAGALPYEPFDKPASAASWLRVWHLPTARLEHARKLGGGQYESVAFSPDGRFLATVTGADTTGVLDVDSWTPVWEHQDDVRRSAPAELRWIGDSKILWGGRDADAALVLDAATGKTLGRVGEQLGGVTALAVGADGRMAVAGAARDSIDLYDATGRVAGRIPPGAPWVHSMAFGPDGRLYEGGVENVVKIHDVERKELVHTLVGHSGYVFQVVFSADGRVLATTGGDGSIRLYHTQPAPERWAVLRRLRQLEARLHPIADRWVHEAGGVQAAWRRLLDDTTYTAEEGEVLGDRLMEIAWRRPK
ncbi:MAG: WD40 repeat domain-containing serine/threonine protein kinase [Planctomycetota bacterium]